LVLVVLVALQQEPMVLIRHLQLLLLLVVVGQVELTQIKMAHRVAQAAVAVNKLGLTEQVVQEPRTRVMRAGQQVAQPIEWVAEAVLEQLGQQVAQGLVMVVWVL
jgi:Flp pilus assembly protein TadG